MSIGSMRGFLCQDTAANGLRGCLSLLLAYYLPLLARYSLLIARCSALPKQTSSTSQSPYEACLSEWRCTARQQDDRAVQHESRRKAPVP